MKIKEARFHISAAKYKDCPKPNLPEFAFIGRSNVGKSSLINMLCNNKKLAHTSSTPGKTKLANYFLINNSWYLVDLPGYGYAKTGKSERAKFEALIIDYCSQRENLVCLFVLIDSRLPLQQIDAEFLQWLGEKNIPFAIIYTKADKSKLNALNKQIKAIEEKLLYIFSDLPNCFLSSAENETGREDVLNFIDKMSNEK
ncbi:MAG: ribosome biogenesis GTP-binding protein YihA/YsxC [Bacteroidia bacterium]